MIPDSSTYIIHTYSCKYLMPYTAFCLLRILKGWFLHIANMISGKVTWLLQDIGMNHVNQLRNEKSVKTFCNCALTLFVVNF